MTENEARKILVDTAKSYLGFSEACGKHKQIIDLYNQPPLPRGYKMTYSDPWCCAFESAVAQKCGMTNIIPKECGCPEQAKKFKEMERFKKRDYIPNSGDICYYDWQSDGTPDHVGIVEKVSEGTIYVIEGNYHDSVGIRPITVGNYSIYGFGLPDFAWWAKQHTPKPKDEPWYIKDGTWQEGTRLGIVDGNRPTSQATRAEVNKMILTAMKLMQEEKS